MWRVGVLAIAACGRIGFAPLSDGALDATPDAPFEGHLVRVLHGTETLDLDLDVTLTAPIVPEHAFLVFTARSDETGPRSQTSGQITGPTQIHFHRPNNGRPMTVTWYVIELDDTASVQRGGLDSTVMPDIPIAPINLNESFALISWSNGFNSFDNDDFVNARLDPTSLHVAPGAFLNDWQVISMPSLVVQHGTVDLSGTSVVAPITPVPVDRTMLLLNWTIDLPDSGTTIGPDQVIGSLATDQLTITRGAPGELAHIVYQLVTFPPGSRVLTGETRFDNTQTSIAASLLAAWDPARSFAVTPAQPYYGTSTYVGDNNATCYIGGIMFTVDAASGIAVQLDRAAPFPVGNDTATASFQVVELLAAP
ncbi:MAG TPA: hypothetical protein VL326_01795 [Kofleriaceae bacterium]|nr:hypothetical protein [Kofleriaceae bacterium]